MASHTIPLLIIIGLGISAFVVWIFNNPAVNQNTNSDSENYRTDSVHEGDTSPSLCFIDTFHIQPNEAKNGENEQPIAFKMWFLAKEAKAEQLQVPKDVYVQYDRHKLHEYNETLGMLRKFHPAFAAKMPDLSETPEYWANWYIEGKYRIKSKAPKPTEESPFQPGRPGLELN